MALKTETIPNSDNLISDHINSFEKPLLAFDALSKLTKQFAYDSDLNNLLELMLLSLSGQFSIPNSFVILWHQHANENKDLYSATGVFKGNDLIIKLVSSSDLKDLIKYYNEAVDIEKLKGTNSARIIAESLIERGIILIAPLWHQGRLIGVLGFGPKANKKEINKNDITLFTALIYSIVPLIANSLLFAEISSLNQWYRNILDNIQQSIFVFDRQDSLIKLNNAGIELINSCLNEKYSIESLHGMPLKTIFPDDIYPKWASRIFELKNKKGRGIIENLVTGDKSARIFNARISKAAGKSGGDDLIIALEDMTSIRENERRFFELEKLAEKGLMASSISHELNNYLALISGGVELTKIVMNNGDILKANANLEKIASNLEKMTRFVKGLLNYGVLNPHKAKANINTIVSEVSLFIPIQKKFKNINLEVDCYEGLPELELDIDQISQLILNLINNSIDAINEARRPVGNIKITTKLENNSIILSISDNGAGIKPEIKSKLFEMRFTTKQDGHGFGLATCAKILENHHGKIEIESVVGIGTTMKFAFPFHA